MDGEKGEEWKRESRRKREIGWRQRDWERGREIRESEVEKVCVINIEKVSNIQVVNDSKLEIQKDQIDIENERQRVKWRYKMRSRGQRQM